MTVIENVMVGCHTRSRGSILSVHAAVCRLPSGRGTVDARNGRGSCSNSWESPTLPTTMPRTLPSASSAPSNSPGRWRSNPGCCCSTNPPQGLTCTKPRRVGELIRRIRDIGITVLIVEHDMSLIMSICDELLALSFGRKIAEGKPHEVQRHPEVIRVYLGAE